MVSVTTLIITSLVFLLLGAVFGALLYSARNRADGKSVEQRLQEAEENLQRYQQDVASHFAETAQLVNNLTESYREVHEHLANGALKLTTPAISRQILESANTQLLGSEAMRLREEQFDIPRDWAPKTAGAKGALSEDFGLRDEETPDREPEEEKEQPEEEVSPEETSESEARK